MSKLYMSMKELRERQGKKDKSVIFFYPQILTPTPVTMALLLNALRTGSNENVLGRLAVTGIVTKGDGSCVNLWYDPEDCTDRNPQEMVDALRRHIHVDKLKFLRERPKITLSFTVADDARNNKLFTMSEWKRLLIKGGMWSSKGRYTNGPEKNYSTTGDNGLEALDFLKTHNINTFNVMVNGKSHQLA